MRLPRELRALLEGEPVDFAVQAQRACPKGSFWMFLSFYCFFLMVVLLLIVPLLENWTIVAFVFAFSCLGAFGIFWWTNRPGGYFVGTPNRLLHYFKGHCESYDWDRFSGKNIIDLKKEELSLHERHNMNSTFELQLGGSGFALKEGQGQKARYVSDAYLTLSGIENLCEIERLCRGRIAEHSPIRSSPSSENGNAQVIPRSVCRELRECVQGQALDFCYVGKSIGHKSGFLMFTSSLLLLGLLAFWRQYEFPLVSWDLVFAFDNAGLKSLEPVIRPMIVLGFFSALVLFLLFLGFRQLLSPPKAYEIVGTKDFLFRRLGDEIDTVSWELFSNVLAVDGDENSICLEMAIGKIVEMERERKEYVPDCICLVGIDDGIVEVTQMCYQRMKEHGVFAEEEL